MSLGLAIIIGLISGLKIVPFFSILIGIFVTGLVAGVPADKLGFNFTVALILGETIAKLTLASSSALFQVTSFTGEPVVALSITVAVAIVVLAWSNGLSREKVAETFRKSLGAIAVLLLTIGAGGGLKQTLIAGGN